jgi:hypothetical protein
VTEYKTDIFCPFIYLWVITWGFQQLDYIAPNGWIIDWWFWNGLNGSRRGTIPSFGRKTEENHKNPLVKIAVVPAGSQSENLLNKSQEHYSFEQACPLVVFCNHVCIGPYMVLQEINSVIIFYFDILLFCFFFMLIFFVELRTTTSYEPKFIRASLLEIADCLRS